MDEKTEEVSLKSQLEDIVSTLRLPTTLFPGFCTLLGALYLNYVINSKVLVTMVITSLSYALAWVIDEMGDVEIDRVLGKKNPFGEKGNLSHGIGWSVFLSFVIIILSFAFLINVYCFSLLVLYNVINIIYSMGPRLSDRGLIGNITLTSIRASLPFLIGATVWIDSLHSISELLPPLLSLSILLVTIDALKDFRDFDKDWRFESKVTKLKARRNRLLSLVKEFGEDEGLKKAKVCYSIRILIGILLSTSLIAIIQIFFPVKSAYLIIIGVLIALNIVGASICLLSRESKGMARYLETFFRWVFFEERKQGCPRWMSR